MVGSGAGCRIRPYVLADAPALFEAARESIPAMFPWMPWCHPGYTVDEAERWLAGQVDRHAAGTEYQFAVLSSEGHYLGGCGLNGLNLEHRFANLGYWIRSSATGLGFGPQAVRLVSAWAFAHTTLERLEILVACDNQRSRRVAEKAGAVFEGVLRARIFLHGRHHDARLYSLLRADIPFAP
jgi:ribosomal-protein-serine acetyltransferase